MSLLLCVALWLIRIYTGPALRFVLVFYSPFNIAITSFWEERADLSAFRTFVCFARVEFCSIPLPLDVSDWLRLVIVRLPGLFFSP